MPPKPSGSVVLVRCDVCDLPGVMQDAPLAYGCPSIVGLNVEARRGRILMAESELLRRCNHVVAHRPTFIRSGRFCNCVALSGVENLT